MKSLTDIRDSLSRKQTALTLARENILQERKRLGSVRLKLKDAKRAQVILQEVAEQVQNLAHKRISSLVSKCLSLVFEEPYKFKIEFEKKRNKTEAYMVLIKNGQRLDPDDSIGGGVLDVASFALRLACLSMRVPQRRRVVILDEPFKHLSSNYRSRVRQMIEMLSEEMGMQFIISTHSKLLQTGTVIELQ